MLIKQKSSKLYSQEQDHIGRYFFWVILFSKSMSHILEGSIDGVKLPAELVRAVSIARENGIENRHVEMIPTLNTDAHKRLRAACIILHGVFAFSQARDDAAENRDELLVNLLQPSQETILYVTPDCLSDLARSKNEDQLHQLGGVEGVATCVRTDAEKGIQGDDEDIARRRLVYGSNSIHKQPPKALYALLETIRDPIIIVLLLCAILALSFGIKRHGKGGLSDGISIFFAVFLVITVTAFSNHWPKRQLFNLSKARDNFNISVIRNSQRLIISVFEAVVGDVVFLKTGDQVPADGLYISGNSLWVDESNVRARMVSVAVNESHNPFLLSGTKVINGSARMLVTAVGKNTEWGKLLSLESSISDHSTPLQKRLQKLSKLIAIIGSTVASIVLVVLLIRYFTGNMHDDSGKSNFVAGKKRCQEVFADVIGILATPFAIALTSIPEGLLLAIWINIAFSTKRMTSQKAEVRNLTACETIGTTSVICTDERCLTLNLLAVTEFCLGYNNIAKDNSSIIHPRVFELLSQAVFLTHPSQASSLSPSDSPDSQIDNAIQEWGARDLSLEIEQMRANYTIHQLPETSISEKRSFTWIKNNKDNSLHGHQKGEAEGILPSCSHYYDESGNIKEIANNFRENMEQIIQEMKSKGLQCIAFAHKSMLEESDDDQDGKSDDKDEIFESKPKEEGLIFIGFVGLKYPCRPEVRNVVQDCQKAGLDIKIVTRNDPLIARATAIDCGILEANRDMTIGEEVDGPKFRTYADNERLEKSLGIRVMARASTLDKLRMVQCLKEKGEVVAVTGDTTGDASVLREADVGISLGTQGTQQAKANSDVIVLEDNFHSLARALIWGRAMYHKIQLYAQFQLTVSISSLVIDFVTTVSASEPPTFNLVTAISSGKVPYATLQVLWVKLIVGILAAVAITIEEPVEELGQLPKVRRDQSFITNTMWKNIVGNAVYPIIILLTIQFQGQSIFKLDSRAKDTMIFNIFVLWQLCVILNTKGVERNMFEGIWRRKFLWGIIGLIILLQVLIVEPLHTFANTKPLTWKQWMVCVGIAVLAWPIGWLVEIINCSTEPFFSIVSR